MQTKAFGQKHLQDQLRCCVWLSSFVDQQQNEFSSKAAHYIRCLEDTVFECWHLKNVIHGIRSHLGSGLERWQDEKTRDQKKDRGRLNG